MIQTDKAVSVRGITKQYGRRKKVHMVLDHLDMDVDKGTIYGLLGASGCGKTTLLTCIVGRRSITSGEIWVLGGKPGSRKSGVPGPRLGYMPQEIALVRQFSIRDALQHFGWIYEMDDKKIEERIKFLSKLLELPDLDTKVQYLSGGQQRRVSLAVALASAVAEPPSPVHAPVVPIPQETWEGGSRIERTPYPNVDGIKIWRSGCTSFAEETRTTHLVHDPELMILDEPTVGLDPVLRQTIWDHLVDLATNHNKTIIITTHYIEEARQAHKIGLMRNGRLLAEDSPESLLRMYNCGSIEEVFLRLSSVQEKTINSSTNDRLALTQTNMLNGMDNGSVETEPKNKATGTRDIIGKSMEVHEFLGKPMKSPTASYLENLANKFKFTNKGHIRALMSKNWYRITRHPGAIIFIFFFPMLELCSFYMSVGGRPQGLKLGIVNEELQNYSSCSEYVKSLEHYGGKNEYSEESGHYCTLYGLSCKFLESFDDGVAIKVPYPDLDSAMRDAKAGKLISVIHFARNFSEEFELRIHLGTNQPLDAILNGEIAVSMDMSRYQSAIILERQLRDIHKEFMNRTFTECEIRPQIGNIPINFEEPVYGSWNSGFRQFMTPGVVTTMIFFLSVSVTSTIIVVERLDGIWDRTLLAGVSSTEILISHIILEAGVILLQVIEVIIFVFFIFRMPCNGSFISVILLLALQGFCGMCGGFLLSVSCSSVTSSNFISMGSFYPMLILSGLLWPVEGMPDSLKAISSTLPTTQATLALRNIMEKGWGVSRNYVYQGYLISILWIFIFSATSVIVVRIRK